MYKRPLYQKIMQRMEEPRAFMQVLAGPRQVGKSTLAHQVKGALPLLSHYASADGISLGDPAWIAEQWELGRLLAKEAGSQGALLILDEIQKIPYWSDAVKKLWDEDTFHKLNLKVLLLGSATLLIQTGLGESLAGRFEVIPVPHWSFGECREAFDWTLEKYIYFGGYPGAVRFISDEDRWSRYIIDSIIETSISRDIMLMTRVHKPALLRNVLELGCYYTGHVLSYQRMLGQLQDAGNSSTLAHYLELLSQAGLVTGLQKFYPHHLHQRASSPKLQVFNTALTTAHSHFTFERIQQNQEAWNRLVATCIGAHLLNSALGTKVKIFYWKEGSQEIDFIVQKRETVLTIRVKNTTKEKYLPEFDRFDQINHPYTQKNLLIGKCGIPVKDFLLTPLDYWIDSAEDNVRKRA